MLFRSRAIAYDQRDTRENIYEGESPYTIYDLAQDCVDFLAAMGIEKAHVMGTSYGGTIAMMTAIHFPERVQSLVLAATTPSFAMTEFGRAPCRERVCAYVYISGGAG